MDDKFSIDELIEKYTGKVNDDPTSKDFDIDAFLGKTSNAGFDDPLDEPVKLPEFIEPEPPKQEPVIVRQAEVIPEPIPEPIPIIEPVRGVRQSTTPSYRSTTGSVVPTSVFPAVSQAQEMTETVSEKPIESDEVKAVAEPDSVAPVTPIAPVVPPVAPIKPEMPAVPTEPVQAPPLEEVKFTAGKKKSRINTAVIENLVKLKRSKKENTTVNDNVTPVNRANVKDIDLGLEGKIIPKTEQLEISEDATDEEKMAFLEQRRKNKVEGFVLNADADEAQTNAAIATSPQVNKDKLPIDEFTDFEQAPSVMEDILQLKNNLVVRMCVLIFTVIFSAYISVANDFGLPIISTFDRKLSPEAFVFTNSLLGIIAAFASYTVIIAGIKNLIKLKADCDSVAAIGIIVTVAVGIIALFNSSALQTGNYHIYTSVAILGLLINTLGKLSIVGRTERNFRYVSGEFEKHAVVKIEDEDVAYKFTKGTLDDFPELATMKKTEFVDDFLANSYSSDVSDEYSRKYAPVMAILGVLVGILAFAFDRNADGIGDRFICGLSAIAGAVSICSSMALMLIVNIPLSRASKKYLQSSAVMLGYSAVDEYSDTNSLLVDVEQLFPEGMVDLVNLKAMSSTMIEDCILLAASLACQAGSVLKPTFYKMLRGKTEMLYPVESYIYEDGLGLSGWIENKRVLLGTRELMENHSIDGIPTKAKEAEYAKDNLVLYLSISGVVSAMFFVRANASLRVTKWLQELERQNITVVIRSVDAFISHSFLSDLFDISADRIKILPFRFYNDYEKQTSYTPKVSSSMMCSGHFTSLATLICGTKTIQMLATLGIMITFTSAILGGIISLIMAVLGNFGQLSASVLLCYNLIWIGITLLIQQTKKL